MDRFRWTPALPASLTRAFGLTALLGIVSIGFPIPTTAGADDGWQELFERRTISDGRGNSLPYRLMLPEDYDPQGRASYPLVLFLHGAGERGEDNEAQLKHGLKEFAARRSQYPAFVVAPQCPEGARWVDVDWSEATGTFPDEKTQAMDLALLAMDRLIATERVDRTRIYVTGLSMGGYGTWFVAGQLPSRITAAVPICGGGDTRWAERYRNTAIWAFHGDADTAVPVERSRQMIEAIRAAGGEPRYTEYEGVGHDSWTATYANDELYEWLFSQQRRQQDRPGRERRERTGQPAASPGDE